MPSLLKKTMVYLGLLDDEYDDEYDDYHAIQGLPTAMTVTSYKNGDMVGQRYLTKVTYNVPADPSQFDPAAAVPKLKK